MKNKIFKILRYLVIVLFWIAVWWFAAWRIGKEIILPSPASVFEVLSGLIKSPEFYQYIFTSLKNVAIGIVVATAIGVVLAAIASKIKFVYELFSPVVAVVKATPVASIIIAMMLMMSRAVLPSFITGLIVFPVVYSNMVTGFKSIDPKLREVSAIYKLPISKQITTLYIPSSLPYFLAAMKASLGLAWKAGIAAEILAVPEDTIGRMIQFAKNDLESSHVFAWTLVVVVLSIIIEFVLTFILKKLFSKVRMAGGVENA